MRTWKPTVTLLSFLALHAAVQPQAVFSKENPDPAPAGVLQNQAGQAGGNGESVAVEQTLRKALEKSEADRADIEKRYNELSGREAEARQEVSRLAAEKEAIEKSCSKPVEQEVKQKPVLKAKKQGSSRRWWGSGSGTVKKASSSAVKKTRKKSVKTAGKRVKVAAKGPVHRKKVCSGPVVSMAEIKRALAGKKNLSGKNLGGLNLAGMSLVGANLKGACLAGTNLTRADLGDADLERSELSGANLSSSSLRLANLNAALLDGAILDNAIWTDSRVCLPGSVGVCRDVIP